MSRTRRSLAQKLLRAAESPFFELPKGWQVLSRYRTAELFLKHPSPPALTYTDSSLYQQLLRRYPEVKLQPLRINSSQPSLATCFVHRQHQAIEQIEGELAALRRQRQQQQQAASEAAGADAQQLEQQQQQQQPSQPSAADVTTLAFRQVEAQADIQPALQAAGSETSAGGFLELIQEQEEAVLRQALKRLGSQEAALQKK